MTLDIIDIRMPGLLKTQAEYDQGPERGEMAQQLEEIDAEIGDDLPSDDWFAMARNVDIMAISMRFWRKRGAPPALLDKLDEFARLPGLEGAIFARIRENLRVQ